MAVAQNKVVTAQGLRSGQAFCTTAKTILNTNLNAVLAFTAGPNGSVVYSVRACPTITVTAVQLQLYRSTNGAVLNLIDLFVMPAYTLAPTTAPTPGKVDFGYSDSAPLRLAPLEQLWCAIGVTFNGIVFDVTGEDL